MESIFIERLAQRHGTAEWCNERDLGLGCQGQSRHAGRRSDVAKQRKHITGDQFFGIFDAAGGLIAIIELAYFNLLATNATLRIDLVKIDLGTLVKLNSQLRGRAGEGSRLAENDFALSLRLRS